MKTLHSNRYILPPPRILTCGKLFSILFAAALLSSFIYIHPALAQEDLNGSDLIVTGSGPWNLSYTNSNNSSQSHVVVRDLVNGTRYTYSGALTGNIFVDVTHQTPTNNENRFTLSNTGNSFTGGLAMHNGILFVSAANQLPSTGRLTLDNAVLMSSAALTFSNEMTIPANSFAGLRSSQNINYSGVISGSGDLLITTENSNKVTLSGTNTYTGVTSIGTHQGGSTSNSMAYLILGADNTLPSTTVVEIGKSQNHVYSYTGATTANLELNGKTQTIAGLYGAPVATVTSSAASTLTINTPASENYVYDGSISGTVNLIKEGAGTQTFSGNGKSITLASLAVNDGTLAFGPGVNMTVSGKVTTPDSTLDLNGSNLTYKSKSLNDYGNVNITNTNSEKMSVLTFAPTEDISQTTYSKTISGNTSVVVKLKTNQNNNSRFYITGTNDFTGGLYIEQGTVRVDNYAAIGGDNGSKVIEMKHSSLMTNQTFGGYTINLVGDVSKGERGAIRTSNTGSDGSNTDGVIAAKFTGVGSLEIVNDGSVTLTNTQNDYEGKTYIANFGWRKGSNNDLNNDAFLYLGASEVLPNSTIVVFGYDGSNAEADSPNGNQTLDLNAYNETVAGIDDRKGKGIITSSTPATLTLIGEGDYSYAGKVTGSAILEKSGAGTLTMTGSNTGSLVVSGGTLVLDGDNTGVQSITVKEGGALIPKTEKSMATTVNLQTTAFAYPDNKFVKNTDFVISENGTVISVPMAGAPSGTYARQLFTGASKDFRSFFTNPEYISNMDAIANTAYYVPGNSTSNFAPEIWGDPTKDQNNTNLLITNVVNTTESPITLDFAYQFRNSAYLAITDSKANRTDVMNWVDSSSHTVTDPVSGVNYEYATNSGTYTFKPGETYTIEARLFRFNKTIGANGGGVNGTSGTLVGLGARVSGTDGEYLPLNYNGNNWTFSDGSFITSTSVSYNAKSTTINSGATLEFNTQNNDFIVTSPFKGEGTLIVNPNEGITHTYSENIGGSLSLRKTGDGVLVLNHANDMTGTVDVQAGEVVYAQAGAMNFVSGLTIAQDAQMTVNLPAPDGAAGVNGSVQNNGTITITKGRLRTYGITGNGTIVMDGGTLMNLGRSVNGNHAETIVDNAIVIEEGKTGTFNVGWAKNSGYPDSKLQLNGSLSGAGDFILETNSNTTSALSQIAPLIANFASSEFTGNVITNSGYNMLVMGKENAFGESVGTLQDNGWVDINGFNQTFAGLTGTGNLINRGSVDATFTLNVPEGETSKFEGIVYGVADKSGGKSYKNISFVKTGAGTAQFDAGENDLYVKEFNVNGGRLDVKEYLNGVIKVNAGGILSPGNSIGKLTINNGDLTVASGGQLLIEVGTDEYGAIIADQLIVNGAAHFDEGSVLWISMDPNSQLSGGDQFTTTLTMNNATEMFDSVSSALKSYYFTGLNVDLTSSTVLTISGTLDPNAVPEPSTWALLLLGAAGLMYLRKRSK